MAQSSKNLWHFPLALAAVLVLSACGSEEGGAKATQVAAKEAPTGRTFRLGGMVEAGSVRRDGVNVHFVVTDTVKSVPVQYQGILPDLFKEGKGVVAQGRLDASRLFVASEVLAKHDENYMPPEAQHALDEAAKARMGAAVVR